MDVLGTVSGVQDGDVLRVGTQAIAGVREIPDPALRYAPASNTASFECGGTTLLCKAGSPVIATIFWGLSVLLQ